MRPHPRVIPILLLSNQGFYKTTCYKKPVYIGDPLNTLKIFNEKETDEIIIIDISATKNSRSPNFDLLQEIVSECFMPICYGGGVQTIEDIKKLFQLGIEKVSLNAALLRKKELVTEATSIYGSQSIVGVVDINKSFFGRFYAYNYLKNSRLKMELFEYIKYVESLGVGELLVNFVYKENTQTGYELELLQEITKLVSIPVIANGGVGRFDHLKEGIVQGGASAAGAGSFFVFNGPHKAVLITYPKYEKIRGIYEN